MGANIIITGGLGSIGREVVKCLHEHDSEYNLTIFDYNEQRLFEFSQENPDLYSDVDVFIGDVCNRAQLDAAVQGGDYIIHAAALKQISQSESYPYTAARTNIQGTWNVIQAATEANVKSLLTISTDKAVNPTSIMGATKLIAERITTLADHRTDTNEPRFGNVRLGNVIGSAGSVVEIFNRQIENGDPITLTDPEMTRFAMSKQKAAKFIIDRTLNQPGGTTEVPKIHRLRLSDLTEAILEENTHATVNPEQLDIKIIGPRPGERTHEYLIGPTEVQRTQELGSHYRVHPPQKRPTNAADAECNIADEGLTSASGDFLSKNQIIKLLRNQELTDTTPIPNTNTDASSQQYRDTRSSQPKSAE